MGEQNQIHYLRNKEIDKTKWDACIETASNGLIYAYSFYLDTMAKNWDAVVLNDYEAVMPLTWNKKLGIVYLYQPAFTASLGVFGKNLSEDLVGIFIITARKHFQFIEIALNTGNILSAPHGFSALHCNYILKLEKKYEELVSGFRENHIRNIKKAFQSGCTIKKSISIDEIIRINQGQMNDSSVVKEIDYENFKKLFTLLKEKKQAETYSIVNEKNVILSSCVFFFSHNRAYYILVGNTVEGRSIGASHALIDAFIKENAGKNLILDFEGSDIVNLALFYKGFGAVVELYPFLKINRLPFYLRWLKN